MYIDQCEQTLQNRFDKNPNQGDNLSQLTSNARTGQKSTCIDQMGGISQIKNFLTDKVVYASYKQEYLRTHT